MKKWTAILLTLCLCFSFCACDKSEDEAENAPKTGRELPFGETVSVENYAEFRLRKIQTVEKLTGSMQGFLYYENEDPNDTYVDMIFDWTNTGNEAVNSQDLLEATATGADDAKYKKCMYAVESSDYSNLNQYFDINPGSKVRLHCAISVPKSETDLTIKLKIDGKNYTMDYTVGTTLRDAKEIKAGDTLNALDYAEMMLCSVSYADEVLPSDTSGYYSSYKISDSANTYLVVNMDIVNYMSSAASLEDFVDIRVCYMDKYQYTGFIVAQDEDGTGFSYSFEQILPLTKRSCYYLIEVPKSVTENPATITFFFAGEEYTYSLAQG